MILPRAPGSLPRTLLPAAWLIGFVLLPAPPCSLRAAEPAAPQAGSPAAPEAGSTEQLEKDLRAALAKGQIAEAMQAMHRLATSGDPKGYEVIATRALLGSNPQVDKYGLDLLKPCKDPAVRRFVYGSLKTGKGLLFKSRILLLEVAAHWAAEPAALAAIHAALGDTNRAVVLAAIQELRKLKRPESLPPLIELYAAREKVPTRDRLYYDLQKALQDLTGTQLEASVDFRNVLESRKTGQVIRSGGGGVTGLYRGPSFFSIALTSDRILFIIDTSHSMLKRDPQEEPPRAKKDDGSRGKTIVKGPEEPSKGKTEVRAVEPPLERERLYRVKEELVRVVNSLPSGTRFGILSFNHRLEWWGTSRTLTDASAASKGEAVKWVKGLAATGATRTDLALQEGLSVPDVDTICVLTDGAPRDELNHELPIAPILANARHLNRFLRCRIHTVSFEQIRDQDMITFVRKLAEDNDGICTLLK